MRKIEITEDGSTTIYVEEINEHYHSIKGAMTESKHIFIDKGLKSVTKKQINVLEIGFGTGLNALLTALEATRNQCKINYITLEKYPLHWSQIEQLKYPEEDTLKKIHDTQWNEKVAITHNFTIKKIHCDVIYDLRSILEKEPDNINVVYFDAFSPEKQPKMWDKSIFEIIFAKMSKGAILTTYCAKGRIRRLLQEVGFIVERLEGPPRGKREILRGNKI